ncbi:MAG TPA: PhoU domain-containing protein [Longimicrobiaceae bacterium]|nr:PhoU domain-containing protein [Longimicrobiaceae bacterium]
MVFKLFGGRGSDRLESIEAKVQEMLAHDRRAFDLAMSALLGDVVAREVNAELRATDQKVNRLEREIRRELVVHASVFGGIDSPAVLVYMSVVKDIERVGDYAKNLLDLARDGASFAQIEETEEWWRLATELSQYIADAGEAFRLRDGSRCRALRTRGDALLSQFDKRVSALIRAEDPGPQAVSRALAYRYLKRVVAHLMNLLSAVIMPLDRLDYFDEDPEDRPPP